MKLKTATIVEIQLMTQYSCYCCCYGYYVRPQFDLIAELDDFDCAWTEGTLTQGQYSPMMAAILIFWDFQVEGVESFEYLR